MGTGAGTLKLGVKKIVQEDVDMIGTRLPSLVRLCLRIPAFQADRVMIAGSTGFRLLKFFGLDCDGMSWLTFEAGAMPKLEELELWLDPAKLTRCGGTWWTPGPLQPPENCVDDELRKF
ncbi:hypothetical protein ACP4OV_018493 [Aristida adscensionis]